MSSLSHKKGPHLVHPSTNVYSALVPGPALDARDTNNYKTGPVLQEIAILDGSHIINSQLR